jgi:hypothetical protein
MRFFFFVSDWDVKLWSFFMHLVSDSEVRFHF